MHCAVRLCGHCQLGPMFVCAEGPVLSWASAAPLLAVRTVVSVGQAPAARPTVAVWKFASCDGCQLSLLDCEDELLAVAEQVRIAYFLEATRATVDGPYDLSLVEGSVTTDPRRRAHPGDPRRLAPPRDDRRLRDGRRDPGAAQPRRHRRLRARSSTPHLATSRRWPPRHRSAPTSRSTSSCGAARSTAPAARRDRRLPRRTAPQRGRPQRVRRVQAARQRVRDGRRRHAVPRTRHARRLRRPLPHLPPWLLRLLRPGRGSEPGLADRRSSTGSASSGSTWCACCARSTWTQRRSSDESARLDAREARRDRARRGADAPGRRARPRRG